LLRYPELRVSLAHFGGFEEGRSGGLEASWEEHIGELLGGSSSRLFADLSYFSEILPGVVPSDRQDQLRRLLASFLQKYDQSARHLMYGSDWTMLGREPGHERYLSAVENVLGSIMDAAALQRCMGLNAGRWLGLGPEGKNRGRIERYRKSHGLSYEWLGAFNGS
jgi:hypothetical protein